MSPTLYFDFRCLQDHRYRIRGIGQHFSALLRARASSEFRNWRSVALIDPDCPKPPPEWASLVDEVSGSVNPRCSNSDAIFIDGTPMTHDPGFTMRFVQHPAFFKAAAVYDFIPLDWPGYLPTLNLRIEYLAKMARLRKFDFFLPISEYTGWRLSAALGIPEELKAVTGASVRRAIYEMASDRESAAPIHAARPYLLMVVGPDGRKNPEVAVKAVRNFNLLHAERFTLKIAGDFHAWGKEKLLHLAGHAEGCGFLEFHPNVPDEELVSLYKGAFATIVPSHVEGFSLPIVESAVCGCPVIASTCAAHLELIDDNRALFQSDDPNQLLEKLEQLVHTPGLRNSLVAAQSELGPRFHEERVGGRFWTGIDQAYKRHRKAPMIGFTRKPWLAFLSPFPPDQSGVALYTALAIQGGAKFFNADIYSDARRPFTVEGSVRDGGKVSIAPMTGGAYDAIISVLGNSHYHNGIYDFFEAYGGPCILHDARLIQIYVERLGHAKFLELASRFLGRPIAIEEVQSWLHSTNPATLFLEAIVERASPLMVHTSRQQAEIKKRYGANAEVITSCPTIFFSDVELSPPARLEARARLGVGEHVFLVSSFGYVGPEKGTEALIFAIEILRSWNVPAELHFVGNASIYKTRIDKLSAAYGLSQCVNAYDGFTDSQTYRDFLIASDAAVQLRTYAFGQLSAALTDCISAGISVVSSEDLAASCDAPEYVLRVPDQFSPLQVAEKLAEVWDSRSDSSAKSKAESRVAYLQTHNFEYYAKRLVEILGFE